MFPNTPYVPECWELYEWVVLCGLPQDSSSLSIPPTPGFFHVTQQDPPALSSKTFANLDYHSC